jgi:hypothetical protein
MLMGEQLKFLSHGYVVTEYTNQNPNLKIQKHIYGGAIKISEILSKS